MAAGRAQTIAGVMLLACSNHDGLNDPPTGAGNGDAAHIGGGGGQTSASDAAIDAYGLGGNPEPPPCDFSNPVSPYAWPPSWKKTENWAAPLDTNDLGGHGHDDGYGVVGYCGGDIEIGSFFRLIAAGFETDEDLNGDGDQDDSLDINFWQGDGSFNGVGESAGLANIYVQVITGTDDIILNGTNAPDMRIERTIEGGGTELFPLTIKSANEFQTSLPMTGGGVRYGISMVGPSDRVINLRMPNDHLVSFVLVFRLMHFLD